MHKKGIPREQGEAALLIRARMDEKKRKEFLALTPLERIRKMNAIFNDIIALKAKTKGVKEYEVYRKYLKPR